MQYLVESSFALLGGKGRHRGERSEGAEAKEAAAVLSVVRGIAGPVGRRTEGASLGAVGLRPRLQGGEKLRVLECGICLLDGQPLPAWG